MCFFCLVGSLASFFLTQKKNPVEWSYMFFCKMKGAMKCFGAQVPWCHSHLLLSLSSIDLTTSTTTPSITNILLEFLMEKN